MEQLRLKFERKPPKREAKIKVSSFIGKIDPEAYMKWETKMKKVFGCNSYNEEKKVMLATSAFKDYASIWWVQHQKEWSRCALKLLDTWKKLKSAMRICYAPKAYHTHHNKVQSQSKMSKIIEVSEKASQYESTRRKRE
ncbi:hypothetical protein Lal_00031954 [Lupinus albus]|nr:hypothetical protein Lal_00031954 [Lupinus albus]